MNTKRLECVTVCIGYSDFLAEIIPWNRTHFDKWVIVTSIKDKETIEIAKHYGLSLLITEDADRDGEFSKGRLIERGLQQLSADSWIMHMDADIALPMTFRKDLERANIQKDCIHGFDRLMVHGHEEWDEFINSGWMMNPKSWHPHGIGGPEGFEIGTRWAGQDGYVPIGFAQLWHRLGGMEEFHGVRLKPYPMNHGTACRGDVQFGLKWDRNKRILIPEILCVHLESKGSTHSANWKGRKTPLFRG